MKIKSFFIIGFLIQTLIINAQVPNWAWANGIGGYASTAVNQYANDIVGCGAVTDNSGNVYSIGIFQTPTLAAGNYTLTNSYGGDTANLFIIKHDALGNALWAKGIACSSGGIYTNFANIAIDDADNIYITGGFKSQSISFDALTLTKTANEAAEDIFIAKYMPNGNIVWAKTYGGSQDDYGNALTVDNLNNIYLNGNFSSPTLTIDTYSLTNDASGNPNMFVAKFDNSGNVIYAKTVGLSCTVETAGKNLTTDVNNNLFVVGAFSKPQTIIGNDTLHCNSNSSNYFIAKYDATGNALWAKCGAGSNQTSEANDVEINNYGSIYISGNFRGTCFVITSDTLSHSNGGGDNAGFLTKYSSSGTALWVKNMNTATGTNALDISLNHVTVNTNGNIYVAGAFANGYVGSTYPVFGTDTLHNGNPGQGAIYIAEYDTTGNSLWGQTAESNAWSEISQVTTDKYGNIYVIGSYQSPTFIFGTDTLQNINIHAGGSAPDPDYFIAKIGSVGLGIEKYSKNASINIYPNPSNGNINITSTSNIDELKITNLLGQTVYETKPRTTITTFTLNDAGVYFITITGKGETSTKKVIINK